LHGSSCSDSDLVELPNAISVTRECASRKASTIPAQRDCDDARSKCDEIAQLR
jgi:hypothetical protein